MPDRSNAMSTSSDALWERLCSARVCVSLGFADTTLLLNHARLEAAAGESFLEVRLDFLEKPLEGAAAIREFRKQFPGSLILAACRRKQNHGRFQGTVEEQLAVLDLAAESGAQAIDLEIETAEAAQPRVKQLRERALVIVSYHNSEATPPLEPVVKRIAAMPADGYKVATTAVDPSDDLRVLSAIKGLPAGRSVALAAGELGLATRVLSPAFGGAFTFAAPSQGEAVEPGQVTAAVLRERYHIGKLTKSTKIFGIIAQPVRHSISPTIHNRAFEARNVDAVYLPFLVAPTQLQDFFKLAAELPIRGFSVTIPHKQEVIRYLDELEPLAKRMGAVNTVWRESGKWHGTNTDGAGVVEPLKRVMNLAGASIVIAGNGGAARGAAFALLDAGARIAIVGRNPERVQALANACGAEAMTREQLAGRHFDAVLNSTSLGMSPHVNECFFEGEIPGDIVFDMVYNPAETLLLKRAREQGKTLIGGIEMFIEQGVRQFEIYTGESAPREVMLKTARQALGQA